MRVPVLFSWPEFLLPYGYLTWARPTSHIARPVACERASEAERQAGMQKAGSTKVRLSGFLLPGHRWLWTPCFLQQPPAAATDAFPSSDCWMTAPSLVGLELASQTGHRGWGSGGGRVWERGRSALGGRSGYPALPAPAARAVQQQQLPPPQPQPLQQREREARSPARRRAEGRRRPPQPSLVEPRAHPGRRRRRRLADAITATKSSLS